MAYGLCEAGAAVTLFNRTAARGEELAASLGLRFGGALSNFRAADFDILANATAAGFRAPDVNPVAGQLAAHLIVMDAAFIPVRSKLIRDAAALGCRTIDGTRMMLHQACAQVEFYTGCAPRRSRRWRRHCWRKSHASHSHPPAIHRPPSAAA
ncbi:shikimate dehydrogenase family protein [Cupriavidus basilensis]